MKLGSVLFSPPLSKTRPTCWASRQVLPSAKNSNLICIFLPPLLQGPQYIHQDSNFLVPVACFFEFVEIGLWAIWEEKLYMPVLSRQVKKKLNVPNLKSSYTVNIHRYKTIGATAITILI